MRRWLKQNITTRDALMFLVFVMFSTLLWMSRSDNNQRQHTVTVDIHYIGITPDILFAESLPQSLKITFTDNNRSFFYTKPNLNNINIDLSNQLESRKQIVNITTGTVQQIVKDELPPSAVIQRIEPASFQTSFTRLKSKSVPVVFNGSLQPAPQYQLVGDITLDPASITIYGKKETIDTIKNVTTIPLNITNIKDKFTDNIDIQELQDIRFSQQQVTIHAQAQAFTETTIKLPIHITDLPENVKVKTFPAEVSVKMQMAVASFHNFRQSDVRAFVNYNDMLKSTNGVVKVYVATETTHIFNTKIQPENVEFIIERN